MAVPTLLWSQTNACVRLVVPRMTADGKLHVTATLEEVLQSSNSPDNHGNRMLQLKLYGCPVSPSPAIASAAGERKEPEKPEQVLITAQDFFAAIVPPGPGSMTRVLTTKETSTTWQLEKAVKDPPHCDWPRVFADRGFCRTHVKADWNDYKLTALEEFAMATDDELEAAELQMHLMHGNAGDCWCDEDGYPRGHPLFWARAKAEGRFVDPPKLTPEETARIEAVIGDMEVEPE